jgi:hypothetical protein
MKDLLESYPDKTEKLLLLRHYLKMIVRNFVYKEYGNSEGIPTVSQKNSLFL